MNFRVILWSFLAASLFVTGCQQFELEAGFKQPAELTATAQAQPPMSSPTPKPQLGKLAFVRGGDIWVKELPDGEEKRLTQDGRNSEPRWSSSGEWLAFRKEYWLWVSRPDGAGGHRAGGMDQAELFAWSPKEDRLAYTVRGGVAIEMADGSGRKEIAPQIIDMAPLSLLSPGVPASRGVFGIAWSPDGQWIAFDRFEQSVRSPKSQGLWRARADGSEVQAVYLNPNPLLTQSYLASWSPDGQYLLFWHGEQMSAGRLAEGAPLMSVKVDGGAPFTATQGVMLPYHDFLDWSPDGRKLALVTGGNKYTWENKAVAIPSLSAGESKSLSETGKADLFPSWSPDGRELAVASGPAVTGLRGGETAREPISQRRIWSVKADGSAKRQLTNDAGFRDERPLWSEDGSHILFARFQGEQAQVWLMRADGSGKRRIVDELTPSPNWYGNHGYLDWERLYDWWSGPTARASADSSIIVEALPKGTATAVSTPAPEVAPAPVLISEGATIEETRLYVSDVATGKVWMVGSFKESPQWSWSPDGRTMARGTRGEGRGGETGGLDLLDLESGTAKRILKGDIGEPAWSPDGSQIAFIRLNEIRSGPNDSMGLFTINRDGSGLRQYSLLPGVHTIYWSPRGDRIAFAIGADLFLLDTGSGEVSQISRSAGSNFVWSKDGRSLILGGPEGLSLFDAVTKDQRQLVTGQADNPALSPDGLKVLASNTENKGFGRYPPEGRRFFTVNLGQPTYRQPLVEAQKASWSPDGKRVAYLNNGCEGKAGDWDIYTLQSDGTSARKLTNMPADFKEGAFWSPTGSSIAFTVKGKLMTVDAESGEVSTLAAWDQPYGFHMHESPWSPDGRYVVFQVGLGHGFCE